MENTSSTAPGPKFKTEDAFVRKASNMLYDGIVDIIEKLRKDSLINESLTQPATSEDSNATFSYEPIKSTPTMAPTESIESNYRIPTEQLLVSIQQSIERLQLDNHDIIKQVVENQRELLSQQYQITEYYQKYMFHSEQSAKREEIMERQQRILETQQHIVEKQLSMLETQISSQEPTRVQEKPPSNSSQQNSQSGSNVNSEENESSWVLNDATTAEVQVKDVNEVSDVKATKYSNEVQSKQNSVGPSATVGNLFSMPIKPNSGYSGKDQIWGNFTEQVFLKDLTTMENLSVFTGEFSQLSAWIDEVRQHIGKTLVLKSEQIIRILLTKVHFEFRTYHMRVTPLYIRLEAFFANLKNFYQIIQENKFPSSEEYIFLLKSESIHEFHKRLESYFQFIEVVEDSVKLDYLKRVLKTPHKFGPDISKETSYSVALEKLYLLENEGEKAERFGNPKGSFLNDSVSFSTPNSAPISKAQEKMDKEEVKAFLSPGSKIIDNRDNSPEYSFSNIYSIASKDDYSVKPAGKPISGRTDFSFSFGANIEDDLEKSTRSAVGNESVTSSSINLDKNGNPTIPIASSGHSTSVFTAFSAKPASPTEVINVSTDLRGSERSIFQTSSNYFSGLHSVSSLDAPKDHASPFGFSATNKDIKPVPVPPALMACAINSNSTSSGTTTPSTSSASGAATPNTPFPSDAPNPSNFLAFHTKSD